MIGIVFSLLTAWILSWFGFYGLVSDGFMEFFDKEITKTGYYFIFAVMGAINSMLMHIKTFSIRSKE